jgi:hypothetical protein
VRNVYRISDYRSTGRPQAANQNDRQFKHALNNLRYAMELYKARFESVENRLNLEALEYLLRSQRNVLLNQHPGELFAAHVERGAQLAMLLAWIHKETGRLTSPGADDARAELRDETIEICQSMRSIAHAYYNQLHPFYHDLLLSEAQVQSGRETRLFLLRLASKGTWKVENPDQRARLYARIGALYHEYFERWNWGDCLRGYFWKIRAMQVLSSAEARDEIQLNFWRCE